MRAATLAPGAAPRRGDAEAGRVREPAHLRRVRIRHRRRARRARNAAPRGRLPQGRRRGVEAGARSSCSPTRRRCTRRSATTRLRLADARLMTPSPLDQPRRRVGESQHAARRQGVSAGLGLDQLAALGHPGFARHVVVRPRLRLLLAAVQPRRARAVQPLPRAERAGGRVRARRQRLQDVVRPEHQRRYAAAPHRDPAPLQRDARRRVAARRLSARAARSPTTCSRSATRTAWSTARPAGVDMFGITSWRNIIPYYTLDGAVTEINAEALFALEAAAMLGGGLRRRRRLGALRRAKRSALREAILAKLFNDDTSAFVLNYDQDGNYQDNFTADEVFPVLFGVADEPARRAILQRLLEADFVTPVGLRTISTADMLVLSVARLRPAGRRVARPHAVVRGRARAQRDGRRRDPLPRSDLRDDGGRQRRATPFPGSSPSGSTAARSPTAGCTSRRGRARSICGPSPRRSCGLDGYRTSGRPHLVAAASRPQWQWTAAARVHWGGSRRTYVIDHAQRPHRRRHGASLGRRAVSRASTPGAT